jgi:sugar lactone lactonase YvrE
VCHDVVRDGATRGARRAARALGLAAFAAVLAACAEVPGAPAAPVAAEAALFTISTGLQTPECALHDSERDVYLVSNINEAPLGKDNNGFISRISPDGRVLDLKWIEGGRNGVTLHAPKGMAITRGTLYVADIDELRLFDATTGAAKGSIAVSGATFLNDVEADSDGRVYVSDSGLRAGKDGLEPTGTDAVHVIEGGRVRVLVRDPKFGVPNGLLAAGGTVWVANFGSAEVVPVDRDGRKGTPVVMPKGQLDGIAAYGNEWIVSSWLGTALYRGSAGTGFREIVTGLKSPGDIAIDAKRRRVLVPQVFEHQFRVYALDR